MKKLLLLPLLISFFSCGNKNSIPNTDLDVASAFIRDIQQNDFSKAHQLLLTDETNEQYFDRFRKHYESKPAAELEQYRNSDIIINELSNVSDSVSIINYSNSFNKTDKSKIKVVRHNGQWLVDLKYTFSGNL